MIEASVSFAGNLTDDPRVHHTRGGTPSDLPSGPFDG
jgi:hypothetical protein